jgi:hypothetical protein
MERKLARGGWFSVSNNRHREFHLDSENDYRTRNYPRMRLYRKR